MWRIKNQPSNSTSCDDNALRMLVGPCDRHITLMASSGVFIFNLGLRFEGLFWGRYILKGQIAFEGHWRLQSWTLVPPLMARPGKEGGEEGGCLKGEGGLQISIQTPKCRQEVLKYKAAEPLTCAWERGAAAITGLGMVVAVKGVVSRRRSTGTRLGWEESATN